MQNVANGGLGPQPGAAAQATFPTSHLDKSYDPEFGPHFPEKPEYATGTHPIRWPPGFLGYIAKYLYSYSVSPVPEFAIATAISLFAGICGRGWIYSGTGLNHDVIILGLSGIGKNVVHQGTANITNQISGTPIDSFIVTSKLASHQALLRSLTENPCYLQLIGEVGKMYRAYSKSRHGDNIDELFTTKLDLWERSGPDGKAVGIIRARSENDTVSMDVKGIAHSTLGDSTTKLFYGAITSTMMSEGLISRLWIIEYEGEDPELNEHRVEQMPKAWVDYLSDMVRTAAQRMFGEQQRVDHTEDALTALRAFGDRVKTEKRNAGQDDARRQLWVRAYEKVMRLAALMAVADNHVFPRIDVKHVDFAIHLLEETNLNMQRRICDGDISDDADHTREQMIIQRCVRWLTEPRKDPKEQKLQSLLLIPRRYLQQELSGKEAFNNHRLGATTVFNVTMRNLVDSGVLMAVDKGKLWDEHGIRGECWRMLNNGTKTC